MSEIYQNIDIFSLKKNIIIAIFFGQKKTILTIFLYDISDFLCLVRKPESKVRSVCENECGKRFLYRIKCYFCEMHTEMLSVEELNICRDFCHVLRF